MIPGDYSVIALNRGKPRASGDDPQLTAYAAQLKQ